MIQGELVSDSDDPVDGILVEIWRSDVAQDRPPHGGPVDGANHEAFPGLVDTAEVDENGQFSVDTTTETNDVFLRVFDGQLLLAWGQFDVIDGSLPIDVHTQGGIDWRIVGGIAGGVSALAGVWFLLQDGDDAPTGAGGGPDTDTPDDSESPDDGAIPDDGATPDNNETPGGQDGPDTDDPTDPSMPGNDGSEMDDNLDFDPELESPDESGTTVRRIAEQSSFLYTGDDSVQQEVDDEAIEAASATVLRGRVTDRGGDPLPGVSITVQGHPEFGRTETRENGLYDLVVTGGRQYTVTHSHEAYLTVQRRQEIPANDYHWVGQVALTAADDAETLVETGASEPQVHAASTVEDDAGSRQTRLYFPPGTRASTGNDGSGQATELAVRATEYSVGVNGQEAMPSELPTGTGYTYAAELTANPTSGSGGEGLTRPLIADARGDVEFDNPVVLYQENFLGFSVGEQVPTGVLGREDATWDAVDDGRVIEVLDVSGGTATLDVTGSGSAASGGELSELGITDTEREQIANAYDAGATVWRVPIDHFTPYDLNWTIVPDNDERPGTRGDCE